MWPFDKLFARRQTGEPRYPTEAAYVPYRNLSGVNTTPANSMQNTAVLACVTYIQQSVGMMPWRVMQETDDGVEVRPTHRVDKLLYKRPNPEMSSFQFRETLLNWALLYGNGYAEIEWGNDGMPWALWPIHPDRVLVCRDAETGKLEYEITSESGEKVILGAEDVFHIRGFGHGPVGISYIEQAALTLGWARASQMFGASFFGNGAHISGIIRNKKALSEPALKLQKAEVQALYRGPHKSNKVAHLDNDAEWVTVGTDPTKSQLIDLQHFLVEDVCRIFGVPPHIVAELARSTNNNIEHQGIEAVVRCLSPWVVRFEDEADYKLFPNNRLKFRTEMDMAELMRGDFKSQAEAHQIYRNIGVLNANEIRRDLSKNRIGPDAGGDKYTMQQGFTELNKIGMEPVVAAPARPAPAKAALSMDEMAAISELRAMADNPLPPPVKQIAGPKQVKTTVTEYTEDGRIKSFVREEV